MFHINNILTPSYALNSTLTFSNLSSKASRLHRQSASFIVGNLGDIVTQARREWFLQVVWEGEKLSENCLIFLQWFLNDFFQLILFSFYSHVFMAIAHMNTAEHSSVLHSSPVQILPSVLHKTDTQSKPMERWNKWIGEIVICKSVWQQVWIFDVNGC